MKNTVKKHGIILVILLFLTVMLTYPYLARDFLAMEHDTFFHVSRIENLSLSIRNGDFFPAVYPYENNGFGYASPSFYSDFFLIIPALLHIAGLSVVSCYKFTVFVFTYISLAAMYDLAYHMTKGKEISLLAATAYAFSNYHITDIFVRGALGEVMAIAFLPEVILAMYLIILKKEEKQWVRLALSLAAMILSHNITFLLTAIVCVVFFLVYLKEITKETFLALCKGAGMAFALTMFFTLPMIEQLKAQELWVSRSSSNLASYAMDPWQYFANKTVFGLAGNNREHDSTMLENIGYFLTFAPLLVFAVKEKKKGILFLTLTGYAFMALPSSFIPWKYLTVLKFMQFPWRLNTIAMCLLSVPAAYGVSELTKNRTVPLAVILILAAEGIYHLQPALARNFGMPGDMSWQEVLDGAVVDPYYSAFYVRVELAGADYLPVGSPDFRERNTKIKNGAGMDLDIEYTRRGNVLNFTLEETEEEIVLPLTWYKGYQVYRMENGVRMVRTYANEQRLVTFQPTEPGRYMCMYNDTALRRMCKWLSTLAATFLFLLHAGWKPRFLSKPL